SESRASAPIGWIRRYRSEGVAGLHDRSSRPRRSPTRTAVEVEVQVLQVRRGERRGAGLMGAGLGIPPRTATAPRPRHRQPHVADCEAWTGERTRARGEPTCRYERRRPGELVHMDVKKLGRIPDGGGWRADGGTLGNHASRRDKTPIGYDYVVPSA